MVEAPAGNPEALAQGVVKLEGRKPVEGRVQSVVFVTGGNRGIGNGLVEAYAKRPNTTVVASVRNKESGEELEEMNKQLTNGSKIIVVKIDSMVDTDAKEAVKDMQARGIDHIDLAVLNSGIATIYDPCAKMDIDLFREHIQVNAIAPLCHFQAIFPLLKPGAQVVFNTSGAGSISKAHEWAFAPWGGYGASKACTNYLTRKLHHENPELIIYAIDPGWAQTRAGTFSAGKAGLENNMAPLPLADSIKGLVEVFDQATRENSSGRFIRYDLYELPW